MAAAERELGGSGLSIRSIETHIVTEGAQDFVIVFDGRCLMLASAMSTTSAMSIPRCDVHDPGVDAEATSAALDLWRPALWIQSSCHRRAGRRAAAWRLV